MSKKESISEDKSTYEGQDKPQRMRFVVKETYLKQTKEKKEKKVAKKPKGELTDTETLKRMVLITGFIIIIIALVLELLT